MRPANPLLNGGTWPCVGKHRYHVQNEQRDQNAERDVIGDRHGGEPSFSVMAKNIEYYRQFLRSRVDQYQCIGLVAHRDFTFKITDKDRVQLHTERNAVIPPTASWRKSKQTYQTISKIDDQIQKLQELA
jgi:hypothetical protein